MAEVTGRIGSDEVEFNNAATEATLRLLLQSTLTANKQSIENIRNLAQKSGLDPTAVAATNKGMANAAQSSGKFHTIIEGAGVAAGLFSSAIKESANLAGKLASGAGQASDVFALFSKLPFGIGLVASGFQKLAKFQEDQLATYRTLTNSGVTFGGSLTYMRNAISQTGMTVDEFNRVFTKGSDAFSRFGGTTNEGAEAFARLSKTLYTSDTGKQLRALGYTTEQANEGMLQYINMTGGRTKEEMKNTSQLVAASGRYLEELDALAAITGESRQQLQEKAKEDAANQAWQAYLLTLDEKEREKANIAYTESLARGGKGAAQAVMSELMGLPPLTKASQQFYAIATSGSEAVGQLAKNVTNASVSVDEQRRQGAAITVGMVEDSKRLGDVTKALIMGQSEYSDIGGKLLSEENNAKRRGINSVEDQINFEKNATKDRKDREKSQASAAAETEAAMKRLGMTIMDKLITPLAETVLPMLNKFATALAEAASSLISKFGLGGILAVAIGGFVTTILAYKALISNQKEIEAVTPEGGKGGKGGKLIRGLKGFGAGAVAGMGLDLLAHALGTETVGGASADVASSAAGWAGTGALLGSVIPGLGTAVGGAVGGVAGGAYGLYKNWGTLFGSSGSKTPTPNLSPTTLDATTAASVGSVNPAEDPIESLIKTIDLLNKQTTTVVYYLKETAENTKRTYEATRNLDGNLFPRP